jgi:Cu+-exporting ATPase
MATQVELSIGGMTCSSCSRRVEKALRKIEGVEAEVNYATGVAAIELANSQAVSIDQLVQAVEEAGYTAAIAGRAVARYEASDFLKRFWPTALVAILVSAISMVTAFQFANWQWVVALISFPIISWAAFPFHFAAWLNLRHRSATMDTLVSLGVLISYAWSLWTITRPHALMHGHAGIYFEVATSITAFILLGKYLEHRARNASLVALTTLVELNPSFANRLVDDVVSRVPIDQVNVGDLLQVNAGEQIPVDGQVVVGSGHINSSMVTGESVPSLVNVGDSVIGATLLLDANLTIQATAVAGETVISGISKLVHQAQLGKAAVSKLADDVSAIFVPVVLGLSLATLAGWLATGHSANLAISAAVAVLVIACPCALGLATPTALLVGTTRAAQLGLLIRRPQAIEASQKIDTIFLDKTGTITSGQMTVIATYFVDEEHNYFNQLSAIEAGATHPIAKAIADYAYARRTQALPIEQTSVVAGMGISALISGVEARVGAPAWFTNVPSVIAGQIAVHQDLGHSLAVLSVADQVVGLVVVADSVSATSVAAITELKELGIKPIVISGDHEGAVAQVCAQVGISDFYAQVRPSRKLELIADAVLSGAHVAMVGDGVNDAAALAKAHLSMAMGHGTDVAAAAADVVLLKSDLASVVDTLRLSRATMRTIKANLFWAFAYNVAAIPLAMSGLLSPVIASAAMAFSSVFVVTNSLRLRRFN